MAVSTVMTWNVQNLFPASHKDGPVTDEEYQAKLATLAGVIDAVEPDAPFPAPVGAGATVACWFGETPVMVGPIDRALRLWSDPVPVGDESLAAFRTVYTDPLRVDGVPTALVELVERARIRQSALDPLSH